jgi:hypothetical protein
MTQRPIEYFLFNGVVFILQPFILTLFLSPTTTSVLLRHTRHYFSNQQNISYSFIQLRVTGAFEREATKVETCQLWQTRFVR